MYTCMPNVFAQLRKKINRWEKNRKQQTTRNRAKIYLLGHGVVFFSLSLHSFLLLVLVSPSIIPISLYYIRSYIWAAALRNHGPCDGELSCRNMSSRAHLAPCVDPIAALKLIECVRWWLVSFFNSIKFQIYLRENAHSLFESQ